MRVDIYKQLSNGNWEKVWYNSDNSTERYGKGERSYKAEFKADLQQGSYLYKIEAKYRNKGEKNWVVTDERIYENVGASGKVQLEYEVFTTYTNALGGYLAPKIYGGTELYLSSGSKATIPIRGTYPIYAGGPYNPMEIKVSITGIKGVLSGEKSKSVDVDLIYDQKIELRPGDKIEISFPPKSTRTFLMVEKDVLRGKISSFYITMRRLDSKNEPTKVAFVAGREGNPIIDKCFEKFKDRYNYLAI